MNVSTNGHKKKDPTTGLDDGSAVAALMKPFHRQRLKEAFDDAGDAGIDAVFDISNPYIKTVLDLLAKNVKGVAETTRQEIRALADRATDEGWSAERLKKEIRERGQIASDTRAMTIARTEAATAYSQGSLVAYKVSGVVSHTEWLTAGDDLDCPICTALSGTRAELGGSFDGDIDAPPAHPNCRCSLVPIVE